MTLRTKTLLGSGITLLALVGTLYFISLHLLLSGFDAVEKQETVEGVQRTLNALDAALIELDSGVSSWSQWDESYEYIKSDDPRVQRQYVDKNLSEDVLAQNIGDIIVYVRNTGRLMCGTSFDRRTGKKSPLPPGILPHLRRGSILLSHKDERSYHRGILLLPEGPVLIASRPILNDTGHGTISGSLIYARYLDRSAAKLSKLVQQHLAVQRLDSAVLPADFATARKQLTGEGSVITIPLNENVMAGYTIINDIYGKPALLMRCDTDRDIYRNGQLSVRYLLSSLIIIGLAFGCLTLWGLERWVLSRLSRFSRTVEQIAASGEISTRVPAEGSDELAQLSISVNNLLSAVERAQSQSQAEIRVRRAAEKQLQEARDTLEVRVAERTADLQRVCQDLFLQMTILESQGEASTDGILVISETREILSHNRRFVEMWEIPDDVVNENSEEALLRSALGKVKDSASFLQRVEYLYEHKDEKAQDEIELKDGRTFERYSTPIKPQDGETYGRVWFFRDVTERKQDAKAIQQAGQGGSECRTPCS